jgi:uncharacterized protein YacL
MAMNKAIKFSFAAAGAFTGMTLSRVFIEPTKIVNSATMVLVYALAAILAGFIFYFFGNKVIEAVLEVMDKLENQLREMTLYELAIGSAGLIIGLVIANLIAIPIIKIDIIGVPLSVFLNVLFGALGILLALGKKNERFFDTIKSNASKADDDLNHCQPKVLDTSVIIDGRIADICGCGFIDGELLVPSFVLEELRHIADSPDAIKRNRGRRGLDVLNRMQKELKLPLRIVEVDMLPEAEVDNELLKLAKRLEGKVLTIDYNLSKVADFQKVPVLNINDLANALKPIALPGEDMTVQVVKDGKEVDQGVGYLDDGTMIVIEGGKKFIGENLDVTVTSILQTAAGRMVFAKPKCKIERAI